jgi:hypothetical protein
MCVCVFAQSRIKSLSPIIRLHKVQEGEKIYGSHFVEYFTWVPTNNCCCLVQRRRKRWKRSKELSRNRCYKGKPKWCQYFASFIQSGTNIEQKLANDLFNFTFTCWFHYNFTLEKLQLQSFTLTHIDFITISHFKIAITIVHTYTHNTNSIHN